VTAETRRDEDPVGDAEMQCGGQSSPGIPGSDSPSKEKCVRWMVQSKNP